MARRTRSTAYSASDLHKAVEATRANVTITDSLSSDEDVPPTQGSAAQRSTAAKRSRRARGGRSSKAADMAALLQGAEVTSYIRSTAPDQREAVTMDDLLPLLNSTSGSPTSDQLDEDETAPATGSRVDAPTASDVADPASMAATIEAMLPVGSASEGNQAPRETATPTSTQQSPLKRKRGCSDKADIAHRERLVAASIAHTSANATVASANDTSLPATSAKKRKRVSRVRRESSPPGVEVRDSLFTTQEPTDSVAQDEGEQAETLFRSPSVESESPARLLEPNASHPNSTKAVAAKSIAKKPPQKVKAATKNKGKARAISPEPVVESTASNVGSDSSSGDAEEEVQKSLVQELPRRRGSAKRRKGTGKQDSTVAEASGSRKTRAAIAKGTATIGKAKSTASAKAATPAKPPPRSGKKGALAAATPVASGSVSNVLAAPDSQVDDNALMPTPSASRPKWIQTRLRKLTIQQHKNFLAHRTRSPDRVKGNPWTEDEEITLILALNDMYLIGGPLGDQADITKNQYKRWRYIQEQHGVGGSLSNILAERSNVDLKDKARNIQRYREALGLPVFNWYTYPQAGTSSSQS